MRPPSGHAKEPPRDDSPGRRERRTSNFGGSGCQLLGVTRCGFHDLGSGLAADGVENRVASLVVARARIIQPLPPIGAQRVTLDFPLTVKPSPCRALD
jgi:hypothetical protein